VLYQEGFQNTDATPKLLTRYTGAQGETYTAAQDWLTHCNGIILQYDSPDSAMNDQPVAGCAFGGSGNVSTPYSYLRQEAWALGRLRGNDPTTNNVVSAYTQEDEPGQLSPNEIEFQTVQPIRLASATGRFVTFSVDGAAVNCYAGGPLYNFSLVQSDGTEVKVGDTINMCNSGTTITAPPVGTNPSSEIHVGTYTSNGAVKLTGDTVGIILRNGNGSGYGNDASFDNIQILDATPQLDKSFSPALQRTGDVSTLTFTVTNTSEKGAKAGWGFTDTLPDGLVLADDSVGGSCNARTNAPAGGKSITVTDGNLAAGDSSCTITVHVTATTAGTYANCPGTNVTTTALDQPACASVQFHDPSFTTSKTVDKTSALPGDTVTYTITVRNTGDVPYSSARPASFTDDLTGILDDATYDDDASNGASVSGNTLSWSGPLGVGQTQTITYSVKVASPGTGDKDLVNGVTPKKDDGGTCDPDPDKTCVTHTPVQSYSVEKSADRSTTAPGQKITYTVTVVNTGRVAYTDQHPAGFTDDLSRVSDDATYNGDASDGATVDGDTLTWKGPLAVGETKKITYSFTVDNPDAGDKQLVNGVVPTEGGGSCAKEPCRVETPVGTYKIVKTADTNVVVPGQKITYTVTVVNTGRGDVEAAFTDDLTGVLDDASYDGDATASAGTLSYAKPRLTWNGDVPLGATVTITYSATVNTPDAGDHRLENAITSPSGCAEPGAVCKTDTPVRDLLTAKSASTTTAHEGDTITYTITVTNNGQVAFTAADPATFTDDLTGVLDDAAYHDDARATSGTVSYAKPTLTWSGPLGLGATATITYAVTVDSPDTGDKVLANVVTSPDGNCHAGDPRCRTRTPVASYTVSKQADKTIARPGEVVRYTVTVTNTGQGDYTAERPATFTDDLSQVADDATYNGDATQNATVSGTTLSWAGPLPAGATITVSYSFTVKSPDTGDRRLVNVVTPGNGRCATAHGCTTTTTVVPPALAVTGGTLLTEHGPWFVLGTAGGSVLILLALLTAARVRRRHDV